MLDKADSKLPPLTLVCANKVTFSRDLEILDSHRIDCTGLVFLFFVYQRILGT